MTDEKYTFYERDGGVEIGAILEKARKERGLSLEEVEQATKIRKRYLQGLERDDYGVLPDAVYVQGFLKTYANYLGLDGEELARELKNRRKPRRERHSANANLKSSFDEPLVSPGGLAGTSDGRISAATVITILGSVVVIALLIGALYFIGRDSRVLEAGGGQQAPPAESGGRGGASGEGGPESAGREPAGGEQAASKEQQEAPEVPPDTLQVAVSVEGAPSWLSVQSDGSVVFEQIAQPGFSDVFEAREEIVLSTGNAGAVSVEVNGQDVGLIGGDGEVVTENWTLKSAS